ncbi:MAG: DUF4250 domain-containing protein [Clostridia bacterium]
MLPKDPNILFSLLNMKLRDSYSSLDALCDDMDESKSEIENTMKKAGYEYRAETNSFVRIK